MTSTDLSAIPIFSVIMPVHNAEPTLAPAVTSVLNQTLDDFELIIVDDASTDKSPEIAAAFSAQDPRVSVIRMPMNSGGPRLPRNRGMSRARGSLLAFLDHDDRWLPAMLARHRAKHVDGDFAVTYSRCRIESRENPEMDGADYHSWWHLEPHEGIHLAKLAHENFIPLLTASVTRSWVDRVGPFRGIDGADDWNLWLRVAVHGGHFGFIDESLAIYNWSSDNLSHSHAVSGFTRRVRTLRDLGRDYPSHRALFAEEERQLWRRATEPRMRSLPKPVRQLASRLLVPPRLWVP